MDLINVHMTYQSRRVVFAYLFVPSLNQSSLDL